MDRALYLRQKIWDWPEIEYAGYHSYIKSLAAVLLDEDNLVEELDRAQYLCIVYYYLIETPFSQKLYQETVKELGEEEARLDRDMDLDLIEQLITLAPETLPVPPELDLTMARHVYTLNPQDVTTCVTVFQIMMGYLLALDRAERRAVLVE